LGYGRKADWIWREIHIAKAHFRPNM